MKFYFLLLSTILITFPIHGGILKQKVVVGPEERPATLKLPRFYKETKAYPLVVLLHGRGNSAELTDLLYGLSRNQDQLGYALLLPNGTDRPSDGQKVWNATEDCCGDDDSVDDSSYLQNLVKEVSEKFSINTEQIFLFGHSNGGFMSFRLACDTHNLFKGLVSVAGSTFEFEEDCRSESAISVLQVHGTEDSIVPYTGEGKNYPGAEELAERWAVRLKCQNFQETIGAQNLLFLTAEPTLDENGRPGIDGSLFDFSWQAETDQLLYSQCIEDSRVGVWRINGANHAPV